MDVVYLLLTLGSVIHVYSFGAYMKKDGKQSDYLVISLLCVGTLGLALYRFTQ
ncbi:MAG: hypothetical protein E6713_04380 [Sporomusaceae bacterium]|nr:hypothetical protein [Sporomusaceae bacterium]